MEMPFKMKSNIYKNFVSIFVLIMFVFGIYFITKPMKIDFESFVGSQCPTTMIKDGDKILLYNPKMAKVPGVNPIQLKNLEEYEEYVAWQRGSKVSCPILYLEKVFDIQGSEMYEIKPSFNTDLATGGINHSLPVIQGTHPTPLLDSTRDHPPYNNGQFPPYDNMNQDIGLL